MITELLAKSQENLKSAELSFDATCYNASANRAYYAAIQAAAAAIFRAGLKVEIDHRKVLSLFCGTLISARKLYPSEYRQILSEMQQVRITADYEITSVSKKNASKQLASAKAFVAMILQTIQQP
jgi:uncharacterized protein (UPF0332 family)